jgi:hypothetical protein
MALLTSEVRRIRAELGYNVLSAGAEPYIGVNAMFEQVIQTYMQAGASTTSATAVTAATAPTPVTLTLTSPTGFSQYDRIVVDVDDRQEIATASAVSGSTIVVQLSKAHTGTYPVSVEGGESIVRSILRKIDALDKPGGLIEKSASTAGIKKADEVEFFGSAGEASRIDAATKLRDRYRDELASVLGVANLWRRRSSGAVELY